VRIVWTKVYGKYTACAITFYDAIAPERCIVVYKLVSVGMYIVTHLTANYRLNVYQIKR